MSIYNQIFLLIFILICFGIYKFFKAKKNASLKHTLTQEEMSLYLKDFDFDKEKKVRKQWFFSFIMVTSTSAITIISAYFAEGGFSDLSEITGTPFNLLIGVLVSLLALIPWFWITYHCSYKKKGTAWLIWTMIMVPLRELADFGKGEWNQSSEWGVLGWSMVAIILGVEIFYWINCLKLHKVNSCWQHKKILALKEKYGPDINAFPKT